MILTSTDTQLVISHNATAEQLLMKMGYNTLSTADKNSIVAIISTKDNVPYTDINADYILNYHKRVKYSYLDNACISAIKDGFASPNGHTYRVDSDDQVNMLGQKIELMEDPSITTVYWRAEDINDWIAHTRDDWLTNVFKVAFNHKSATLTKCKDFKVTVDAAKTHDDIIAIKWQ